MSEIGYEKHFFRADMLVPVVDLGVPIALAMRTIATVMPAAGSRDYSFSRKTQPVRLVTRNEQRLGQQP